MHFCGLKAEINGLTTRCCVLRVKLSGFEQKMARFWPLKNAVLIDANRKIDTKTMWQVKITSFFSCPNFKAKN